MFEIAILSILMCRTNRHRQADPLRHGLSRQETCQETWHIRPPPPVSPSFPEKIQPCNWSNENVAKFERIAASPKFHRLYWKYKKSCSFSSKQKHIASF
jgi:hypothetical protein